MSHKVYLKGDNYIPYVIYINICLSEILVTVDGCVDLSGVVS